MRMPEALPVLRRALLAERPDTGPPGVDEGVVGLIDRCDDVDQLRLDTARCASVSAAQGVPSALGQVAGAPSPSAASVPVTLRRETRPSLELPKRDGLGPRCASWSVQS